MILTIFIFLLKILLIFLLKRTCKTFIISNNSFKYSIYHKFEFILYF